MRSDEPIELREVAVDGGIQHEVDERVHRIGEALATVGESAQCRVDHRHRSELDAEHPLLGEEEVQLGEARAVSSGTTSYATRTCWPS